MLNEDRATEDQNKILKYEEYDGVPCKTKRMDSTNYMSVIIGYSGKGSQQFQKKEATVEFY